VVDFFREDEYDPGYTLEDKVVFLSIATGGILVFTSVILFSTVSQRLGGILLIIGILAGVLPYGLLSFFKNRAVKKVENQFPEFLSDLAESKKGGMTLVRAFESANENDYGRMNHEISRIYNELSWGIPFPEVMERFSKRMEDSPVIQESVSIIIQSFKSGGDITRTIESVADDAARLKKVVQDKDAKLQQQLFIMYVIFFLFIGITIGIYTMLGELLGLGSAQAGAIEGVGGVIGQNTGGPTNFCNGEVTAAQPFCTTSKIFGFLPANISSGEVALTSSYAERYAYGRMAYYKALLFIMLIIQGIMTAAVAGQIKEGKPSAGLKHALVMLPIAFVAYIYYVGGAGI